MKKSGYNIFFVFSVFYYLMAFYHLMCERNTSLGLVWMCFGLSMFCVGTIGNAKSEKKTDENAAEICSNGKDG